MVHFLHLRNSCFNFKKFSGLWLNLLFYMLYKLIFVLSCSCEFEILARLKIYCLKPVTSEKRYQHPFILSLFMRVLCFYYVATMLQYFSACLNQGKHFQNTSNWSTMLLNKKSLMDKFFYQRIIGLLHNICNSATILIVEIQYSWAIPTHFRYVPASGCKIIT